MEFDYHQPTYPDPMYIYSPKCANCGSTDTWPIDDQGSISSCNKCGKSFKAQKIPLTTSAQQFPNRSLATSY